MSSKETKFHINLLKHRGNFFSNINSLISLNNGDDYFNIIKKYFTPSNPINKNSFFHNSYDNVLLYTPTGKTSNLFKMLLWSSSTIAYYKNEIINFVSKKKSFDYYVLVGDYENASKELDDIENNISFSMWSLKSRIMLANLMGIRIDEYINSLKLNNHATAYANLYAHFTKVECNINEYIKNIEYITNTLPKDYVNCFLYLYGFIDDLKIDNYSNVLAHCNSYSIIDSYLCVKHIIHNLLSSETSKNHFLQKSIDVLSCIENDDEILLFSSYVSKKEASMSVICQKLSDDFSLGNYEKIFINRNEYLTDISGCSLIKLIIITMSGILSDRIDNSFSENNVLDSIILSLYRILKSDNLFDFRSSLSRIESYHRVLKWFDISVPLFCFWKNCLSNTNDNPIEKCFSIDDEILYNKIINLEFPPIFFESLYYYKKRNIDYVEIKNDFIDKDNNLYTISSLYIQYYVALSKKDYNFATDVFSKAVANFIPLIFRFEVDDLCDHVINNITIRESVSISDVIFAFNVKDLQQYKSIAYKNFLDENNISKPIEVNRLPIEKQLLTYFLKEICNINTMTCLYLTFSNSIEVENHRIEICKYLLENDPLNKSAYSKEISEILKEQEVRKLNKTIDKSKLSIDYQYISEKTYDRFLDLTKMYYDTKPDALEYVAFESPMIISTDPRSWRFIAYSRDVILENMYKIYASEFCFGSRGLDTYLSTRVRHGTFENTIKKVFIENNIYNTENNFFKSMFTKEQVSKKITEVVEKFQEQLLNQIHILTNQKFKVYIENEIEGALFDYNMQPNDVKIIYKHLYMKTYFSVIDFINIISDVIVIKTNDYLSYIRDEILEDFKSEIIKLLDKLNNDVEIYCIDASALSNIRNNISRSKTNIQNKIDEIKNWFYLSESIPMENYTLDKLINVLSNNLCQQFDDFRLIKLTTNNSISKEFVGETFVYFYDILHILLSNAIIHSKFDNLNELEIVFETTEIDDNLVSFCISNNFSQNCNYEKIKESVEKINNIYLNKEYTKVDTHKEGGMGQIKVLDILYNVLNVGNTFKALCDSENYKIIFTIAKKGAIAYDEQSIGC